MGNFLNYIRYFPEFLEDYNLTFIHKPFEYQLLDCDYDEGRDKGSVEGMRTESQQTLYLLHFKAVPVIACFLLIDK